jgi:hypothetical protein
MQNPEPHSAGFVQPVPFGNRVFVAVGVTVGVFVGVAVGVGGKAGTATNPVPCTELPAASPTFFVS